MPGSHAPNARAVFRAKFWLNLVIILIATCWIPLVSLRVANADGTVQVAQVPVYRCYQALYTEPSLLAAAAVAIHIVVSFTISYAFARLLLRAQQES